jgi:hypothetical protein
VSPQEKEEEWTSKPIRLCEEERKDIKRSKEMHEAIIRSSRKETNKTRIRFLQTSHPDFTWTCDGCCNQKRSSLRSFHLQTRRTIIGSEIFGFALLPRNWPSGIRYSLQNTEKEWKDIPKEYITRIMSYSKEFISFRTIIPKRLHIERLPPGHPAFSEGVSEWGLFAIDEIHAGDYIGEYSGVVKIRKPYDNSHYLAKVWMPLELADIQLDIDANSVGSMVRFANGTTDSSSFPPSGGWRLPSYDLVPNARLITVFEENMIRIKAIATTCIASGSEIVLNYGNDFFDFDESDPLTRMFSTFKQKGKFNYVPRLSESDEKDKIKPVKGDLQSDQDSDGNENTSQRQIAGDDLNTDLKEIESKV